MLVQGESMLCLVRCLSWFVAVLATFVDIQYSFTGSWTCTPICSKSYQKLKQQMSGATVVITRV